MRYAIDGKYPIETKDQLSKTAAYFDKYLVRFHPKDRVKIAATMEKRAHELGVYLDNGWVKNYSRAFVEGAEVSPDFSKNIEMRKHACNGKIFKYNDKNIKMETILDKIANKVAETAPYETVDSLFEFDKLAGLEYQWDKTIVDPVMTVFGSLNNPEYDAEKIAGDVTNYQLKKMASNEKEIVKLAEVFGKTFVSEFSKNPVEAVGKLGGAEKQVFCNVVQG
jgi:hypothetical protein